jgi:succinate dehydrogenase flavin-adding protein (antitoxin of CptAB toxin-antitoxin module)
MGRLRAFMAEISLTPDRLAEAGYESLTAAEVNELLRALYEAGSRIVGIELTRRLSADDLDTFERYLEAKDEELAAGFVEHRFPRYRDTVRDTFESLIDDLANVAAELRALHLGHASPDAGSADAGDPHAQDESG